MTYLDDIILGATDDNVSTSNLLRKVLVISRYLQTDGLRDWALGELNGYETYSDLPVYRRLSHVPVMGTWSGPFGNGAIQPVSATGVPEEYIDLLFGVHLRQPLGELESFASSDQEIGTFWDPHLVGMYDRWVDDNRVPHLEMMGLVSARKILPQPLVRGVIDTVRNTALNLALDLQEADPNAGTHGGPTVAQSALAQVVYNVTNNIYGDGTTVTQGSENSVATNVVIGDVESLVSAARDLGLDDEAILRLREAAESPNEERPSRLRTFVDSVKSGALRIAGDVATKAVTGQLDTLIAGYLGQ